MSESDDATLACQEASVIPTFVIRAMGDVIAVHLSPQTAIDAPYLKCMTSERPFTADYRAHIYAMQLELKEKMCARFGGFPFRVQSLFYRE